MEYWSNQVFIIMHIINSRSIFVNLILVDDRVNHGNSEGNQDDREVQNLPFFAEELG